MYLDANKSLPHIKTKKQWGTRIQIATKKGRPSISKAVTVSVRSFNPWVL